MDECGPSEHASRHCAMEWAQGALSHYIAVPSHDDRRHVARAEKQAKGSERERFVEMPEFGADADEWVGGRQRYRLDCAERRNLDDLHILEMSASRSRR